MNEFRALCKILSLGFEFDHDEREKIFSTIGKFPMELTRIIVDTKNGTLLHFNSENLY